MRIGIDIRNIGKKRTGDEAVFFNYVKNLALIDNKNEYLLFTDVLDKSILEKIKIDLGIENKENFKIISLTPNPSPKGRGRSILNNKFIWNAWTLPKYLRKNPVDIYHTQYILPFFVSKKIKLITTIHDISFNFYPQFIKFSDLLFLKILIPWSLRRADKIIAVSEFTKNEIEKYYKIAPEKVAVAYNAVGENFQNFNYSQEKIDEVSNRYKLKAKSYILYLGTMQPRKNLPILIEAYAKIKDKLGNIKLVLVGNRNAHNFDKKIDKFIQKNNLEKDVIFTGYIDEKDKPALYKMAEIFVYPSLYEGFGIPILEAMKSGVPVVASSILPHMEVGGKAVLYFEPAKAQDLADKISGLLNNENLREDLKKQSLEQIQKFSWLETAKKLLSVYDNLEG